MNSAIDVANYFLCRVDREAGDTISLLKLQKLVYYAQAWSLVMRDQLLFSQDIEAWSSGPVVRDVWNQYEESQGVTILPAKEVSSNWVVLLDAYHRGYKPSNENFLKNVPENWSSLVEGMVLNCKSRDIPAPDYFDNQFTEDETEVLEEVWDTYGELSAKHLQDLVQSEEPWQNARKGLEEAQDSTNLISHEDMNSYYVNFLVEA